jgi:hypothetical protein
MSEKAGRKKKPAGRFNFGQKGRHVRLYPDIWSPYLSLLVGLLP